MDTGEDGRGLTAVSIDSPSSAIISSSKSVCFISKHWNFFWRRVCPHGSPYLRISSSALRTNPTACYSKREQGSRDEDKGPTANSCMI
jgi:hypothetical protein